MHSLWRNLLIVLLLFTFVGTTAIYFLNRNGYFFPLISKIPAPLQPEIRRPKGIAPAAFDGFIRACNNANINPFRIAQTLGDHPRSVGYHKRDGTLNYKGEKIDYSAAVDIVTSDLNRQQINRFLESLGEQGFAAFYREGENWKGGEHIHAIYAPLKMKPQLRRQVREWERNRKRDGKKAFKWQQKWRFQWKN
jgi:hypothetical protein